MSAARTRASSPRGAMVPMRARFGDLLAAGMPSDELRRCVAAVSSWRGVMLESEPDQRAAAASILRSVLGPDATMRRDPDLEGSPDVWMFAWEGHDCRIGSAGDGIGGHLDVPVGMPAEAVVGLLRHLRRRLIDERPTTERQRMLLGILEMGVS